MKRTILIFATVFAFACPSLAARVPLERAYIATHGHLEEFLIAPNGLMFPVGYKGLPKNFSSWTLPSRVSIPTLKQAGAVVATPNEKYLYVAGCARDRTRIVYGRHPILEEIAAYHIVDGIPHVLGSPTQIDDCLTGNQAPYQTLAVSRNGAFLFATGGITYHNTGDPVSTAVRSLAIAANGTLTPISTVRLTGSPLGAYTARDSTGKWLFVAGISARYQAPLTLAELHVATDGSLSLAGTTSFAGRLDAFTGLASAARRPLLYVAGEKISNAGVQTEVFGYRIGAGGALTPVPGPVATDTGLAPTGQPNYASLAIAPSGRLLYVLGAMASRADGALIQSYAIGVGGRLLVAHGSTAETKAVKQPQMIVSDPTGRFLYEMDLSAGFMGAPAIVEFRDFPDGAIVSNTHACLGGGPTSIAFCGRVPAFTGPIAILK
ncbi:MAG: lactonase family protein [Vulcanimicrobiaceae bacterium]